MCRATLPALLMSTVGMSSIAVQGGAKADKSTIVDPLWPGALP
jgi:hypothetical protein